MLFCTLVSMLIRFALHVAPHIGTHEFKFFFLPLYAFICYHSFLDLPNSHDHYFPIFFSKYHAKYYQVLVRSSQSPHIFWVADKSYRTMLETGQNQCILVSGESGAGKTESTKYIIRHLMHISPCYEKDLVEKIVQVSQTE